MKNDDSILQIEISKLNLAEDEIFVISSTTEENTSSTIHLHNIENDTSTNIKTGFNKETIENKQVITPSTPFLKDNNISRKSKRSKLRDWLLCPTWIFLIFFSSGFALKFVYDHAGSDCPCKYLYFTIIFAFLVSIIAVISVGFFYKSYYVLFPYLILNISLLYYVLKVKDSYGESLLDSSRL